MLGCELFSSFVHLQIISATFAFVLSLIGQQPSVE